MKVKGKTRLLFALLPLLLALMVNSCKKDNTFNTQSDISISVNQILFDTVFTTIGSTTQKFYIKNNSKQAIKTDIWLAGGSSSNFRINVDGVAGLNFSGVEIPARDSIFLFVKVTVNPQNSNSPMVIKDSVMFLTNGHQQDVRLVAWGQDAHYIVADHNLGSLRYKIVAASGQNITWANDKPYLVYGYAVVDSTGNLNIDPGVQVHFYNGSGMWIYKGGSLKVNGTYTEPVTFQGPRLEPEYAEMPGQWDRIWINEGSVDNVIDHAIIKNGFIGIQAETLVSSMGNQLILKNTQIRNMTGIGLLSRFYRITSFNDVFSNCGEISVWLTTGGSYDFRHCTIANYWSASTRNYPALVVSDTYNDPATGITYNGNLDSAYFGNCIIYGTLNDELSVVHTYTGVFKYFFENCLIKDTALSNGPHYLNNVLNLDPVFTSFANGDYTLQAGSGAIDKGAMDVITTSLFDITLDLKGNSRLVNPPPDCGAYDYRP